MTGNTNGLFDTLPEHWKWDEISNLCHFIVDCLHSTPSVVDYPTGYYMIRTSDVRDGHIDLDSARHVAKEVYNERVQRGIPVEGDIVITREAPLGEVGRIPSGERICLGQRLIHYRPNKDRIDSRFLLYALLSPLLKAQFRANMGTGSIVDNLRMAEARKLKIPLPPPAEQRAIAHVLGTLDDKIELNRRMNATLEAIARAIFKSWFVDFDPVRAKMRGEQPAGMDAATAALFPDAFEDSELGPIPAGWGAAYLPDVIAVNPSRSLKKGQLAPYLEMKNLPEFSARPTSWEVREFGSGMRFINGDVLVARITPCLENGKTVYIDFLDNGQVGWGSTEYIVLHSKEGLAPEYSYFLARSDEFRTFAIQSMTGTSGRQRVPISALEHFLLPVPPPKVAQKFGDIARLLLRAIKANDEESRTLTQLRDMLLPKLIAGELHI